MLAHGTIRSLREVCDNVGSMDGQSVRVMGFLQEFDPGTSRAVVAMEGVSLDVDTSLVPNGDPHRLGSMYQYIGELDVSEGMGETPLLRARVARNVDGLDQETYKRALQVRRKFLSGK